MENPTPSPTRTPELEPVSSCSEEAPSALRSCLKAFSDAVLECVVDTGAPCSAEDAATTAALRDLEDEVRANCSDGDFLSLSTEAVVGRFQNACASEASSLAWRLFGGPQGTVWPAADENGRACVTAAHTVASEMVDDTLAAINTCLAEGDCSMIEEDRAAIASAAQSSLEGACEDLSSLIAVTPETLVARSSQQIDCITATGHASTSGLRLNCGPTNAEFEAPRGEYTRITLDQEKWGSMCGDGSDYSFHIRLAPEGAPIDNIIIALQGGGVCLFGSDCKDRMERNPGLFTAADDEPLSVGIASNDPAVSPFHDWTKIYLPYCNQDVFAGGGVYEEFEETTVARFGAINLHAALQASRDSIWKMKDEEGGEGFRPDQIRALFGGFSAGAYGTMYNYHWLLDELQWPRTAAFPDAGLGLDNGSVLGVSGLGDVKIPAWGTLENLPSYCSEGACAVGTVLFTALSPRLKQVPEQQMLILSNPKDNTQQNDAFFTDEAFWLNTFRQSYCDTKDLPGINYYFTSNSKESIHVITLREEYWLGEVDGETMADWFWRAMTEPDTLQSRVEEANFVEDIPGTDPYPCPVAP